MSIRKLTTINNNKTKLLDFLGYNSIKSFLKENNEFANAETGYKYLLELYNDEVDRFNKEDRIKKDKIRREIKKIDTKIANGIKSGKSFKLNIENVDMNDKSIINLIKKNIINFSNGKKILLKIGENQFYALNDYNLNRLSGLIENGYVALENSTASDTDVIVFLNNFTELEFIFVDDNSKYKKRAGGFFNYTNELDDIDLSRYGIYSSEQFSLINFEKEDECLVQSLQNAGMDIGKVNHLKTLITNLKVPLCKLNDICDKLQIKIILKKSLSSTEDKGRNTYGKQYTETYELCYFEEHFFVNETTEYTSYSIKNYDKIKHIENFNKMSDFNRFGRAVFMSSFKLVELMFSLNYFKPLTYENTNLMKSQYYNKVDNYITDLQFNDTNFKIIENKEKEQKIEFFNVFADFETYKNNENKHIPYLAIIEVDGVLKSFYTEKCALNMLFSLKTHTRLIFHNATYDFNFLIDHLYNIKVIKKGSMLMNATGMFKKLHIEIKCSYHLISMPLADFSDTFAINDVEKEVMPYDVYNEDNIKKQFIPIKECYECFKYDIEKIRFLQNAIKWGCYDSNGLVNIIQYSKKYCEIDVVVLRKGYNTFKQWIWDFLGLDIDIIMTSATLAHKYFINQGCYNNIYQMSGIPREFLQKFVIGGRTMIANNKKQDYMDIKPKNDFDATSLYSSAMIRLDGFLQGKPKIINTNATYQDIKNYDGYFVEIVIKSIGIKRDFPLASFIDKNGVRQFSNEMQGKTYYVDKIGLEDLIEFQNVDFEIVKGYYFDEGFNPKIKEVINYLFTERAKKKAEGNKCEMIYKLIMNSGYGKSIMKTIETETKIFDNDNKRDVYISRNYNWVKEVIRIGDNKSVVKVVKTIDDHFNIAQVGVSILSMSKRIMNEVMCLGEDIGIKMFYQDTDSIHIYDKDIKKLSSAFTEKYGRELIGKKMGQFHSDFDGEIYVDEKGNIIDDKKIGKKFYKKVKMDKVYANRSIFLGKKCYIDELICIDKLGKKYTDYHIRMKGIPNSCILYTTKLLNYKNPFEMYIDLYEGKKIRFDLTEGGYKANFEKKSNFTVFTKTAFDRDIQFK